MQHICVYSFVSHVDLYEATALFLDLAESFVGWWYQLVPVVLASARQKYILGSALEYVMEQWRLNSVVCVTYYWHREEYMKNEEE